MHHAAGAPGRGGEVAHRHRCGGIDVAVVAELAVAIAPPAAHRVVVEDGAAMALARGDGGGRVDPAYLDLDRVAVGKTGDALLRADDRAIAELAGIVAAPAGAFPWAGDVAKGRDGRPG